MSIFKINVWVLLFAFTLPCLFLSEEPIVISIYFFLFFLFYLSFLAKNEFRNGISTKNLMRNKVECFLLLVIYLSYPVSFLFGKEIIFNQNVKTIFSIVYFAIFIDLAGSISKMLLFNSNESNHFKKRVLIFFCLLIPPLGIYYLRFLYNQRGLNGG
jgi:hypothetical protein